MWDPSMRELVWGAGTSRLTATIAHVRRALQVTSLRMHNKWWRVMWGCGLLAALAASRGVDWCTFYYGVLINGAHLWSSGGGRWHDGCDGVAGLPRRGGLARVA